MATSDSQPDVAPHGLDLVIDFVNTLDPDDGIDQLADCEGLRGWLGARGLLARTDSSPSERDRREALTLREALRAVMLAHNGVTAQRAPELVLERAARRGKLAAHFGPSGESLLSADAPGTAGALARLLIPVFESARDGSWERAKACHAGDCRWAFFDRSRNRSARWCAMAVCGNRAKVRSYRARSTRDAPHAGVSPTAS